MQNTFTFLHAEQFAMICYALHQATSTLPNFFVVLAFRFSSLRPTLLLSDPGLKTAQ